VWAAIASAGIANFFAIAFQSTDERLDSL
jgi:hypothetical protein